MARKEPGFKKIEVFPVKVMRLAAVKHIPFFKKRVQRGVDGKGRKFKGYTSSYAEYKRTRFKSKRDDGPNRIASMSEKSISSTRTHPPDLTVTGDMLRNLKRKKQGKDFYTIGFTGEDAQKVDYNRQMGRDITNDIPNKEKDQITKFLAKEMDKQFKRKLKDITITVGN